MSKYPTSHQFFFLPYICIPYPVNSSCKDKRVSYSISRFICISHSPMIFTKISCLPVNFYLNIFSHQVFALFSFDASFLYSFRLNLAANYCFVFILLLYLVISYNAGLEFVGSSNPRSCPPPLVLMMGAIIYECDPWRLRKFIWVRWLTTVSSIFQNFFFMNQHYHYILFAKRLP